MFWLRILFKLPLLLLHVVLGVVLSLLFLRQGPVTPFKREVVRWWLGFLCKILRLEITLYGSSAPPPVYLVSNHVSWLDIIILGGLQPIAFLSKAEISQWPVIGYLAQRSGTLFIQRGTGASGAFDQLIQCLEQGRNALVFPEATANDGEQVRIFYPRLFAAAIDIHATIQPVSLAYPSPVAGKKVHAAVPLHDNLNFFKSALDYCRSEICSSHRTLWLTNYGRR